MTKFFLAKELNRNVTKFFMCYKDNCSSNMSVMKLSKILNVSKYLIQLIYKQNSNLNLVSWVKFIYLVCAVQTEGDDHEENFS